MKTSKMNGPYGSKIELLLTREEFEQALREYLLKDNNESEARNLLLGGKPLSIQLDDHTLGVNHRVKIIIQA